MKNRLVLTVLIVLALSLGMTYGRAFFQRPNPTVVGGATSGGTASSLLVDSDGTLHTTSIAPTTPTDVNIKQENGGADPIAARNSAATQRRTMSTEPYSVIGSGAAGREGYNRKGGTVLTLPTAFPPR